MVIFGKTGTGKSTLLRNLIATDIAADRGVTVVDPDGDTARARGPDTHVEDQ